MEEKIEARHVSSTPPARSVSNVSDPVLPPPLPPVSSSEEVNSNHVCFSSALQEWLFVMTTTFAVAQNSMFSGSVLCTAFIIGDELHMSSGQISWISAAQSLAAGCFLILFGRVADLFGRRTLLIISMAMFSICTLVTGFATSAVFICVCSGITGIASAAAVPPSIGKLGAIYRKPSRRKNQVFACYSAGNPLGFVLGLFISGASTQISGWRTSFWVISVIYAILTVIAICTCPPDTEQCVGDFSIETSRKFDFLGAFLAVTGIGMLTAGLTSAGDAPHGWRTSYVIALLVVGATLVATFFYWQTVFSSPLMPLHIWKDRNFSLLVLALCLGISGFNGNNFWLSLAWQQEQHMSPIMVALHFLPASIGGAIVNLVAGFIMDRVSNTIIMTVAGFSMACGSALFSATSPHITYWALAFPAILLSVLGVNLQFMVTNVYAMSSLPSEQQSVAGGLLNTVSRIVTTIWLAVQTTTYNAVSIHTGRSMANPPDSSQLYRPYQATFWVSLGGAGLALFILPFLTVGRQGEEKGREGQDHSDDNNGIRV